MSLGDVYEDDKGVLRQVVWIESKNVEGFPPYTLMVTEPMAGEDKKYAQWLRKQPCALCKKALAGTVHHAQGAGMALRAHDHKGIPMCYVCHVYELHGLTGRCKGWSKDFRREWEAKQCRNSRAKYEDNDAF